MLLLKHRLFSSIVLLLLDFLWLGLFMSSRYSIMIKNIQKTDMTFNITYAIFAYSLMLLGLNIFVLPNINLKNITLKDCFKYGFLFGIILYGVYDFTAAAVIKNWNMKLAIYDILWGGFVYFIACYSLQLIN